MQLKNHIAYKFLTDSDYMGQLCNALMAKVDFSPEQLKTVMQSILPDGQKAYYITESVIKKMDMIHLKKDGKHFNWRPLLCIPDGKYTIIFPDNRVYRIVRDRSHDVIWVAHIIKTGESRVPMGIVENIHHDTFMVDGEAVLDCYDDEQTCKCEEYIYRALCFMFLSSPEEEIIQPGHRYGTKKQGKLVNSLPFPLTIVNKNWVITSIRNEAFWVRAHYAIRWAGKGRTEARLVLIDPFEKKGYVRKAKIDQ